ncbi:glutamate-5-semialdehyde dehydrogenase [Anaerolineales bacterium HSG24]|nr:glutamate-5-semialdehyde dehydrogenase [Anaerolineales bacterium HSG24]
MSNELSSKGQAAKDAARVLAKLDSKTKNRALETIADTILARQDVILAANEQDISAGRANGLSEALLDRLLLTPARLESMANDVRAIANLPDPIGQQFDSRRLPNGLDLSKRRIPVGVIGVIYESRPNVTIDISTLCLKSGNAAVLRGGREAIHSNTALAQTVQAGLEAAGLPTGCVQLIESTDRALVKDMLRANGLIDMIIPRGGAALHKFAIENASVPVITGGLGICHIYVDKVVNMEKIVPIVVNSKVQRPSVCNALDTLLVHKDVAKAVLPPVADALAEHKVEIRAEPRALEILNGHAVVTTAGAEDFDTEFMALIMAVKVVDSLDEAIDHIYAHSTTHTDAILTEDYSAAQKFIDEVNSSAVMVNASTRFNDGGQFGLGAEVAISTQPLHARGPMGLTELTTYKWVVLGRGQIRG